MFAGTPVGPVVRQLMFTLVFFIFLLNVRKFNKISNIAVYYLLFCSLMVIAFITSASSPAQFAAGVGSFVFYPAIFLFSVVIFWNSSFSKLITGYINFDRFISRSFLTIAIVGILDVFADGKLIEALGYNPNYGGEDFFLITSYNGVTRANAGIADALAFGYLMTVAVIYFLDRSPRSRQYERVCGIGLCLIACMLSLTRGALIAALFAIAVYALNFRRLLILLCIAPLALYLIAISPYAELLLGRFTDSDAASETSSLTRILMAVNSIDYLINNPGGAGIGTQGAGNVLSAVDNRLNTDNYFFHIFLELGLFYGTAFIGLLIWQFGFALKYIKSRKFIASYIFLFLVSSALSSSIAFATLSTFYWFVLYIKMVEMKKQ